MEKANIDLKRSRELIDKGLNKYLPLASAEPKIIHKAMRYSVFSGGKRIRPILTLEACRACSSSGSRVNSGKRLKDALVMGCTVEMVHAYSLIHDDLPSMDDDDFRRGKPTCHKVFGEAVAILAGDALLTLAFNVLSTHLKADTGIRAVRELSEAIGTYGMVGGQVIDIGYKGKAVKRAAQNNINELKTARLFEASVKLGAIAAGVPENKVKTMALFGRSIGTAFQLVDDMMDGDGAASSGKNSAAGRAIDITNRAKDALKIFGKRADRLKEIADIMLKRRG